MECQRTLLANPASYPAPYAKICRLFLAEYADHLLQAASQHLGTAIPPYTTAELDRTYLASMLDTISYAAVGAWDRRDTPVAGAVGDTLQAFEAALFARPGLPAGPDDRPLVEIPTAFWETPIGQMTAQAHIWLEREDLITIAEASRLAGISISAISGRADRGQLTAFPDTTARNPRKAGRLVRRSEVLALGKMG